MTVVKVAEAVAAAPLPAVVQSRIKVESGVHNGSAIIRDCSCKSSFQDTAYGKNRRVHNVGGKSGARAYICTSCGRRT